MQCQARCWEMRVQRCLGVERMHIHAGSQDLSRMCVEGSGLHRGIALVFSPLSGAPRFPVVSWGRMACRVR